MKEKTDNNFANTRGPGWRYQLKITLAGTEPPIWRRILVHPALRLDQLHEIIQIVMGWADIHFHEFQVGSKTYGQLGLDEHADGLRNEKKQDLLRLMLKEGMQFSYEYDFGDHWLHDVLLEREVIACDLPGQPICLAGENACPPEDCGGISGHAELLCESWDGSGFDLEATNAALKVWLVRQSAFDRQLY